MEPTDSTDCSYSDSWVSQPDVCRCCLSSNGTWDITSTYITETGERETYADMLQECYGITLSFTQQWAPRMVCELCVGQLRGATSFRKQVLAADQQFLTYCNSKPCKTIVVLKDNETSDSQFQLQARETQVIKQKITTLVSKTKKYLPRVSVNSQLKSKSETSTTGILGENQVPDSTGKETNKKSVSEFKVPNNHMIAKAKKNLSPAEVEKVLASGSPISAILRKMLPPTGEQKGFATETPMPVTLRQAHVPECENIELENGFNNEFATTKTCVPDKKERSLNNISKDMEFEYVEQKNHNMPESSDNRCEPANDGCDVKCETLSDVTPKSQKRVTKLNVKIPGKKKGKGQLTKPKPVPKVKKRSAPFDTDDDFESSPYTGDDETDILLPTSLKKICLPETDLENRVTPKSFIFTRLQSEKQVSERKRVILTCDIVLKDTNACPFRHHKSWFQCFYCQQDFMEINPLRTHTVTTHSNIDDELKNIKRYPRSLQIEISNLECRHCTLKLTDVSSMRRHFVDVHKKVIYKECIADYKVNRSPYSCHLCEQQFHVFRSLTTHLNEHYANCICDVCGKSFLNSKRLKVHKRTHENGQFPCDECGKVLKTKTSKVNHIESVHCKRIIKCQICFEPMKHYNDRIKHMSEVHNITHTFKCHICSREYNIKHYLATHIRQTHGHRNKCCIECGMAFITNHGLKKHMLKHTGVKPYTCNVCCKSYARSYTLKEHMRAHDNEIFLAPE